MPEHPDRVEIATIRGPLDITWAARDELLHEIRHLDSLKPLRDAFEAAGASRPVALDEAMKVGLLQVLHMWSRNLAEGISELPGGLDQVRHAIADELAANPAGEWRAP
jgi:hypothetical protein